MGEGSWDSGSLQWRWGTEAQEVGGGASSVRRRTLLAAPPLSPPLSPTLCPLPSSLPSGLAREQEPQLERHRRRQRSFGACSSHSSLARGGAGGGRAGAAVRRGTARNLAEQCGRGRCGEGGGLNQRAHQPPGPASGGGGADGRAGGAGALQTGAAR